MDKSLALVVLVLGVSTVSVRSQEMVMCPPELGTVEYMEELVTFDLDTTLICGVGMSQWQRSNTSCGPFEPYPSCSQTQCPVSVNEANERNFYYCCSEVVSELTESTNKRCFHIKVRTSILRDEASVPVVSQFGQTVTVYVPMYAEPQPSIESLVVSLQHDNVTAIEALQSQFLYTSPTSPKLVALFTFDIPRLTDTDQAQITLQASFSSASGSNQPFTDFFPVMPGSDPPTTTTPPPTGPPTSGLQPTCPTASCSPDVVRVVLPAISGLLFGVLIVALPVILCWLCRTGRCKTNLYKVSSTSNGNNSSHQVATSTYNTTSTDQHQADTRTRPSDLPGGELNNGSNGGYHLHPATLESQLSTPATPGSSEFMRLLPPATPPSSSHYALQSIPNEEPQYATCATTVLQNDLTNRPPLQVGVGRNDGFPHPSSSSIDSQRPPTAIFTPVSSAGLSSQPQLKDATYGTHGNNKPLPNKNSDSIVTPV